MSGHDAENGNAKSMHVQSLQIPSSLITGNQCHLRWSNISKVVVVKDIATGLIQSSIASSSSSPSPAKEQQKLILNRVSGEALPSQIMALMGPSGSGKTSLLDTLATRSSYNYGTVSLNSKPITNNSSRIKSLKRKIAYIKQKDIFFEYLTVRDQFMYTALLRLGPELSKEEKREEVDRVIALLRLKKCAETPIRFVSGGERKRVNIGTELLIDPSILLLDEPTSGLDSTSAVALMSLLTSLAHDHGKTVITSIHQPSSAVFFNFDKVLFLADGCVVYYGSPSDSLSYLREIKMKCPDGYNAADHWMDLLVEDSAIEDDDTKVEIANKDVLEPLLEQSSHLDEKHNSTQEEEKKDQNDANIVSNDSVSKNDSVSGHLGENNFVAEEDPGRLKKHFLRSRKQTYNSNSIIHLSNTKRGEYASGRTTKARLITAWDNESFSERIELESNDLDDSSHSTNIPGVKNEIAQRKFRTSWCTQFLVLSHRALKNSRSAVFKPLNFIKSVALGTMVGLLFFQIPYTEERVHDRSSFWFFTTTYWVFDAVFNSLFTFPTERAIIFKERDSGTYHLSAYFMAKTLSELPTRLFLPTLYMICSYWLAGQNPSFAIFLATTLCILVSVMAGESIGLLFGAMIMDFEKAMTAVVVFALSLMVAGGFYVQDIPKFLIWFKYLSPFKYGFDSTQQLVFDRDVPCDGSRLICDDGAEYASIAQVKEYLNVEGSVGFNLGLLLLIYLIPRYFAFLALKSKKSQDR